MTRVPYLPKDENTAQTKVPRPTWERSSPRSSSSRYALATVVRLTPSCFAKSLSAGSRVPSAIFPVSMVDSNAVQSCRYIGCEESKLKCNCGRRIGSKKANTELAIYTIRNLLYGGSRYVKNSPAPVPQLRAAYTQSLPSTLQKANTELAIYTINNLLYRHVVKSKLIRHPRSQQLLSTCSKSQCLIGYFKRDAGATSLQYLAALRIRRAKEILENSSLTVKEIAAQVRAGDVSHFVPVRANNRSFSEQVSRGLRVSAKRGAVAMIETANERRFRPIDYSSRDSSTILTSLN